MELDENKRYPASLIVLLDLVISCPGMLEFDPRGLGTLNHIFCDHCNHPSPEDSWDRRKGCFTTWLTGAHTQPPKLVWPPLTSATRPMPWILTVSTTGKGFFKPLSTFYLHVTGVYVPRYWAFSQKFASTSRSATVNSGNILIAPPADMLPWKCFELLQASANCLILLYFYTFCIQSPPILGALLSE